MLLYDISGDEPVLCLPFPCDRVVEYAPLEVLRDIFKCLPCRPDDILHIHATVEIQAARECFRRGEDSVGAYFFESDRLTHYVGL